MSQPTVSQQSALPDLSAVRARRVRLGRAVAGLEGALAAGEALVGPAWSGAVCPAVQNLVVAWQAHVAETEQDDGLLAQIETDAPRVSPAVDRLRRDHAVVADLLRRAVEGLDQEVAPAAVTVLLHEALAIVGDHRRAGRDLLHEAYAVDIGGE